jgi:hypothetical protein
LERTISKTCHGEHSEEYLIDVQNTISEICCLFNHNREPLELPPPLLTLQEYVVFLGEARWNARQIEQYLSAIGYWTRRFGGEWDAVRSHPSISQALKGISTQVREKPIKQAPPLLRSDLHKLRKQLDLNQTKHALIWFVTVISMWGLFRLGEIFPRDANTPLSHLLRPAHFSIQAADDRRFLVVSLPYCKHYDPSQPYEVPLPETEDFDCPVAAYLNWIRMVKANQEFIIADPETGKLVPRNWYLRSLNLLLPHPNAGKRWTGHSLRSGGACMLALAGVEPWLIQKLGRWKDETFQRYIRSTPTMLHGLLIRQHSLWNGSEGRQRHKKPLSNPQLQEHYGMPPIPP